jgi:tetratricopeptide (TPR) repeat protein
MPVSTSVHISECLHHIITLSPKSVLDIGCGFGLWGFLCREHLDVAKERVQPNTWNVRIDGIELFEPYIQTHQRALYSNIRIADVREAVRDIGEYELIIAGDVIEHLHKDDALTVLDALYAKATRAFLVNIPIGSGWDHPENHGNPGELHRSEWCIEDFAPYPSMSRLFELPCGKYGSFFCPKDVRLDQRVEGLLAAAQHHSDRGAMHWSEHYARQALALMPASLDAKLCLADIYGRQTKFQDAINVLERATAQHPEFPFAYVALAQFSLAAGQKDVARTHIVSLLARTDIAPDLRQQGETLLKKLSPA